MPTFDFTSPDGKTYSVTGPEGATKEQAFQMLQSQLGGASAAPASARKEPFGERLNREIGEIPRQLGLTARHALEGAGEFADFVSTPVRAGLNAVLPDSMQIAPGGAKYLADKVGLPSPQNERERIVGEGTKLGFSSMVPMGIASKAKAAYEAVPVASTARNIAGTFASNPLQQGVSATAGGLSGQYVKETGGDDVAQFAASLAGSIAAPLAVDGGRKVFAAGQKAIQSRMPAPQDLMAKIDITVENALRDNGIRLADLPANVRSSIRQDVAAAMKTDGVLSPDAIRRLADYRLTGTAPSVASLTLDPAAVTQEKNLAKIGINSKDSAAQALARRENVNNRQLITGLNDLGAARAPGAFGAGQSVLDDLQGYASTQQRNINELYTAAKDSQGRAAQLDPSHFSQMANNLLDHNLRGAFVPENIRTMMNDFATGKVPLNVQSSEQFKTIIGNAQRGATDGNVRAALGHIREALDNTPLLMDTGVSPAKVTGGFQLKTMGGLSSETRSNVGQDTIDAFNRARSTNRQFMQQVENNPALAAAMDGAAPDKFFQRHVLNGEVRNLSGLLELSPQSLPTIKAEVVSYLKSKAINGAADEVGNFSQSSYNKALSSIGDQKLSMLFSPEELSQIRAIGRVASYEQFQPRGSAVNNSNTTSALSGLLDRIAQSPLLSKIPFGQYVSGPAQNISVGIKANQAMNVPHGLLAPSAAIRPQQPIGLLMSPAAFAGLGGEEEKRGLLLP